MSSSITDEAERIMLDAMFGAQSVPANYYLGLSETQPAEDGTGVTEPTIGVNAYARVVVPNTIALSSFLAATTGNPSLKKNNGPLEFPKPAGGDWAGGNPFVWLVVFDHATATAAINVMAYIDIVSTPVLEGEVYTILDQDLTFTLD